jgi:amidohydrolase
MESLGTSDLVALRRDLHAHPELAYAEHRTTAVVVDWLTGLGLSPRVLPAGTGVVCDIGTDGPTVALRADIDALPLVDLKEVPYRSTATGVCHGCGHDAHTAILLGAARELASLDLPGRVRLIFQPAEETVPGGALSVIADGAMRDVSFIFALHCDPRLETGMVGLRPGPITAACDQVDVLLSGPGGHTARPHLTVDLVNGLGRLITDLPGLLSRRVDSRAAVTVTWGSVEAGRGANAIPMAGRLSGTLRVLDREVWEGAEALVRELIEQIVAPTQAQAVIKYTQGVPPCDNHPEAVEVQRSAVIAGLGHESITETLQSMGGEDFAWYLEHARGALARLGVRRPGGAAFDLHQGTFDIDEDALDVGVRYTVALAETALKAAAG